MPLTARQYSPVQPGLPIPRLGFTRARALHMKPSLGIGSPGCTGLYCLAVRGTKCLVLPLRRGLNQTLHVGLMALQHEPLDTLPAEAASGCTAAT